MNAAYFQELYAYTFWANRQVWACIEELSDEQFEADLEYSIGSLKIQSIHTMGVEHWWLHFLETGQLDFPDFDNYPDRASIRAGWDKSETKIMAYLATLTPQELTREVKPEFWEVSHTPVAVWQALLQVANHSTDHRAQMLAGLHKLGARTIEQDYLEYHFVKQAVA